MDFWNYVKADPLFKDILPEIKSHKYKIRGKTSRNVPCDFSDEEIEKINETVKKLKLERKLPTTKRATDKK